MSELIPPPEANSPHLIIHQEVQRYIEGLTVGDLRFTAFHDHYSVYATQQQIFEFEEVLESAQGFDRIAHASDHRLAENRHAIALERQADRCATMPGYYNEYSILSDQFDQWITRYEDIAKIDSGDAMSAVVGIMRAASQTVLERTSTPPDKAAVL
jgi:hypothetical protein